MSRDEDLSELNLSPAPRAVQSTGLASRRWALVMLVFGVVVGVVLGQLAALFRPDLMAWMTEPVSTPVISTPTQSSGPEAGEAGQAYGSGLSNPSAALASRGISASDMRVISRIQDLSEQIEALPTQFAPPTIHGVSGPQHPASWIESVGQTLSGFFLIRKLSDSERFQLDATGYELAKRQIEQRLLAARLSVQMGEHGLARSDMSQATLLMARTLDPRDTEVLRAVAEAQAITDLLGQQP
ncbi:MAG: hypothetical protein RL133_53 [Pseudomonadota bacterium]|jgi:hypothetical protein